MIYLQPGATECSTSAPETSRIVSGMDRRAQLQRYIDDTRANQRTFTWILAPLLAISLLLLIWSTGVGMLALVLVGIIAVGGHWVLHAHLESHHTQLAELGRMARPPEGPTTGGHRRWDRASQS